MKRNYIVLWWPAPKLYTVVPARQAYSLGHKKAGTVPVVVRRKLLLPGALKLADRLNKLRPWPGPTTS